MKRRDFLAIAGIAMAGRPRMGAAQPPNRIALIGILAPRSAPNANDEVLRKELQNLGHIEGGDIRIEFRGVAGNPERLDALASALVKLGPTVIVASGSEAARAAMKATDRIPIVMGSANPVGIGAVSSLARPAGNVTGVSFMAPEASGKRLELLRELIPGLARLAAFVNPNDPSAAFALDSTKQAAESLAIKLQMIEVRRTDDFAPGFAVAVRAGAQAAVLLPAPVATDNAALAARLSLEHRLPAIASPSAFARAGGLLSFGANLPDSYRRLASYVDRILKGAKPGDLPIEQPTKFELVINLKTAKALGITIPQSLLLRADEVIQ